MEEFYKFIEDWGTLLIAATSLLIAIISLVKSSKAQRLQNRVNELEIKIKEYELDKIEAKKAEATLSCVEARVIHISKDKYRLKIWNSGSVKVYNVSAKFEEGSQIILLDSKMPFDELEPKKSFEEHLIVHTGSARKFKITTFWEDENGNTKEKVQMGDL